MLCEAIAVRAFRDLILPAFSFFFTEKKLRNPNFQGFWQLF